MNGRARSAYWVAAGIFLSRISGLIRDRVFAYFFGASLFADAWRAALRLPNVLQNLLGEGTLSASFIPIYAEYLEEGREEDAGRFAGAVLGILLLLVGAFVLVGWFLAPWVVSLVFFQWDPAKQSLTWGLVRILLLMTGTFVISAWCLGVLNSHRKFFLSYVAPVVWNLAMITAMVAGGVYWGMGERDLVVLLAWGAVAGGVVQVLVQLPWVVAALRGFRLRASLAVEGVREAIANFTPVVAARGVVNLSGYVDMILAGLLAEGALAIMGYAQTLYILPISLFGLSVAAAELPELSRDRRLALETLGTRVSEALGRVGYFVAPTMVGYLAVGEVVVAALYQTGAFGVPEVVGTAVTLAAYSLGLLASARSRVMSSAFYALHDTRTPARISYLRVAVSVVVGASLMFPMDRLGFDGIRWGAAGLGLGASVGAWVEYLILRRSLGRSLGEVPGLTGRTLGIRVLALFLAGGAAVALSLLLPPLHPILRAAGVLTPFAGIYLALTHLLGAGPEAR